MQVLSELLLKYKIPGVRDSEIRRICAEEVFALTGYKLTTKQIHYKNEHLRFSVSPVLKSALLLNQKELLSKIQAKDVKIQSIS
jgi:hypothetical protein